MCCPLNRSTFFRLQVPKLPALDVKFSGNGRPNLALSPSLPLSGTEGMVTVPFFVGQELAEAQEQLRTQTWELQEEQLRQKETTEELRSAEAKCGELRAQLLRHSRQLRERLEETEAAARRVEGLRKELARSESGRKEVAAHGCPPIAQHNFFLPSSPLYSSLLSFSNPGQKLMTFAIRSLKN